MNASGIAIGIAALALIIALMVFVKYGPKEDTPATTSRSTGPTGPQQGGIHTYPYPGWRWGWGQGYPWGRSWSGPWRWAPWGYSSRHMGYVPRRRL